MANAEATLDLKPLERAISEARKVGISADELIPVESCLHRVAALALLTDEQRARCLPLLRSTPTPSPLDHASAMVCVAHAAIWSADGVVYGGFVRDHICGGRRASDIDVNVSDVRAAAASIVNAVRAFGISGDASRLVKKGAAQCLTLHFAGQPIDVDLVMPSQVPYTAPGVDCSANNVQLSRSGGLALKVPATASVVSLEMCIRHAQYKKMIFFYPESADPYHRRMQKMTSSKGFTCVPWAGSPFADVTGLPCSWTCGSGLVDVASDSAEFLLVTSHLAASLGPGRSPQPGAVRRLQNPDAFHRYHERSSGSGEPTLMFHGCKTQGNEDAIVQQGFRVDRCQAGGSGFGIWFAYQSRYSDAGYVFTDSTGWKHLFVCLVSRCDVKKDDDTMRVVGQDAAYPQWVIEYR